MLLLVNSPIERNSQRGPNAVVNSDSHYNVIPVLSEFASLGDNVAAISQSVLQGDFVRMQWFDRTTCIFFRFQMLGLANDQQLVLVAYN